MSEQQSRKVKELLASYHRLKHRAMNLCERDLPEKPALLVEMAARELAIVRRRELEQGGRSDSTEALDRTSALLAGATALIDSECKLKQESNDE